MYESDNETELDYNDRFSCDSASTTSRCDETSLSPKVPSHGDGRYTRARGGAPIPRGPYHKTWRGGSDLRDTEPGCRKNQTQNRGRMPPWSGSSRYTRPSSHSFHRGRDSYHQQWRGSSSNVPDTPPGCEMYQRRVQGGRYAAPGPRFHQGRGAYQQQWRSNSPLTRTGPGCGMNQIQRKLQGFSSTVYQEAYMGPSQQQQHDNPSEAKWLSESVSHSQLSGRHHPLPTLSLECGMGKYSVMDAHPTPNLPEYGKLDTHPTQEFAVPVGGQSRHFERQSMHTFPVNSPEKSSVASDSSLRDIETLSVKCGMGTYSVTDGHPTPNLPKYRKLDIRPRPRPAQRFGAPRGGRSRYVDRQSKHTFRANSPEKSTVTSDSSVRDVGSWGEEFEQRSLRGHDNQDDDSILSNDGSDMESLLDYLQVEIPDAVKPVNESSNIAVPETDSFTSSDLGLACLNMSLQVQSLLIQSDDSDASSGISLASTNDSFISFHNLKFDLPDPVGTAHFEPPSSKFPSSDGSVDCDNDTISSGSCNSSLITQIKRMTTLSLPPTLPTNITKSREASIEQVIAKQSRVSGPKKVCFADEMSVHSSCVSSCDEHQDEPMCQQQPVTKVDDIHAAASHKDAQLHSNFGALNKSPQCAVSEKMPFLATDKNEISGKCDVWLGQSIPPSEVITTVECGHLENRWGSPSMDHCDDAGSIADYSDKTVGESSEDNCNIRSKHILSRDGHLLDKNKECNQRDTMEEKLLPSLSHGAEFADVDASDAQMVYSGESVAVLSPSNSLYFPATVPDNETDAPIAATLSMHDMSMLGCQLRNNQTHSDTSDASSTSTEYELCKLAKAARLNSCTNSDVESVMSDVSIRSQLSASNFQDNSSESAVESPDCMALSSSLNRAVPIIHPKHYLALPLSSFDVAQASSTLIQEEIAQDISQRCTYLLHSGIDNNDIAPMEGDGSTSDVSTASMTSIRNDETPHTFTTETGTLHHIIPADVENTTACNDVHGSLLPVNPMPEDDGCTLYIQGLSRDTTEPALHMYFAKWGSVKHVHVWLSVQSEKNERTKKHRKKRNVHARVTFAEPEHAQLCLLAEHIIEDVKVSVVLHRKPTKPDPTFRAPEGIAPRAQKRKLNSDKLIIELAAKLPQIQEMIMLNTHTQPSMRHIMDDERSKHAGSLFSILRLRQELHDYLTEQSITNLTVLQDHCLLEALSGQNVLMYGKRGTGKSLIHTLCIFNKIQPSNRQVQAVVVCSLREHAFRILAEYEEIAKRIPGLRVAGLIGGTGTHREFLQQKKPHIVIGSPGRLVVLEKNQGFMRDVRILVWEELSFIAKHDFMERDMQLVLSALPRNRAFQFIGTSAEAEESMLEKINSYFPKSLIVMQKNFWCISPNDTEHYFWTCPSSVRHAALYHILSHVAFKKCCVYIGGQDNSLALQNFLRSRGISTVCRMAEITIKESQTAGFDSIGHSVRALMQSHRVVLTDQTSSHANFDLVVHFSLPKSEKTFLNRVRVCADDPSVVVKSIIFVCSQAVTAHVRSLISYVKVDIRSLNQVLAESSLRRHGCGADEDGSHTNKVYN